jgi:hypothetical protein
LGSTDIYEGHGFLFVVTISCVPCISALSLISPKLCGSE